MSDTKKKSRRKPKKSTSLGSADGAPAPGSSAPQSAAALPSAPSESKLNHNQNAHKVEKSVSFSEVVTEIGTCIEPASEVSSTAVEVKGVELRETQKAPAGRRVPEKRPSVEGNDSPGQPNKENVSGGAINVEQKEVNSVNKTSVTSSDAVTNVAATKSKSELRAERRALQEAQRAAKGLIKKDEKKVIVEDSTKVKPVVKAIAVPVSKAPVSSIIKKPSATLKQVKLVSHLPQYKEHISVVKAAENGVHPEIIKLGLQYANGTISGSNSRCFSFIHSIIKVIQDFKVPQDKDFSVAIYSMCIEPAVEHLEKCRPISVGMKNVCKMLREEISNIPKDLSEDEVRKYLVDTLELFVENHIFKAHDSIVNLARDKISSKDVIVTYGCSYIIKKVLKAAHESCKFRVIVVDSRPKLEGRNMCHYLVENGIDCTYVQSNALADIMPEATKVFLGAHALLANGFVMSRVGSSEVALVAKSFNKPVLVCCETYKFWDMVQTDAFVINELGNPEDLVQICPSYKPMATWKSEDTLNILNMYYDITPPDLVTVLINEGYVVPCSSVPVVLRVRPTKN
ncbi:hypothetical protein CHUAL_002599 [Chamberlinius hualienensis]